MDARSNRFLLLPRGLPRYLTASQKILDRTGSDEIYVGRSDDPAARREQKSEIVIQSSCMNGEDCIAENRLVSQVRSHTFSSTVTLTVLCVFGRLSSGQVARTDRETYSRDGVKIGNARIMGSKGDLAQR